jgi:hypothetical protein
MPIVRSMIKESAQGVARRCAGARDRDEEAQGLASHDMDAATEHHDAAFDYLS